MIRVGGEDGHGQRFILFVLEPGNVERLTNGEPITVPIQHLAEPGVITRPVVVIIEAPADFAARQRELLEQARSADAHIGVIPAPAKGTM